EKRRVLVRLMGVQRQELAGNGQPQPAPQPIPQPGPRPGGPRPGPRPGGPPGEPPGPPSPALKFYEAKAGFANYHFHKVERDRLLGAFRKHGDFSKVQGTWTLKAGGQMYGGGPRGKRITAVVAVKDKGAADGKNDVVQAIIDGIDFSLEPLNINEKSATFK